MSHFDVEKRLKGNIYFIPVVIQLASNSRDLGAVYMSPVNWATRPKIITCSRLLKTGCNNVVLPTLFIVVNNIVQHCYT